jgi:hypothetical protein
MSKYSLCIIDDKIPVEEFLDRIKVNDTGIIDTNVLLSYLEWAEEITWTDTNLYNLIKSLIEQMDLELSISGFKTHSFFLNYIEECLYSPDIIIFDWDVGPSEVPPEESLKTILNKTYCLVAIYTGYDKQNEIDAIIQAEIFKSFSSRIFMIDKNKYNSAETVINNIKSHLEDFSIKYGRDFKHNINAAINASFCEIGGLSFHQFIKLFGVNYDDEGVKKYQISSLDFIDIMSDQIKAHLISSRTIESLIATEQPEDILAEKKLWHFRMFHEPQDDVVRKGDIVWNKNENRYYLVISSDCHLNDFWKKNLGLLVAVPLYKTNDILVTDKIRKSIKNATLVKFQLSSLVNPQGVNITILPFMDNKDDYIVMLKEIKTFDIKGPPGDNKYIYPLKYSMMSDFKSEQRFRLNEPFLSALIERILRSITDIGVPDYSNMIKNSLEKNVTELGDKK